MSQADRFFGGYYQHRDPQTAAAALEGFFASPPRDPRNVARMFVRAAQLDAGVRDAFLQVADRRADLAQRIGDLLKMADRAALPDPATAPLQDPSDLDYQWSEFLLTGSTAPVARIASVLRWPDLSLTSLRTWSGQRARMPWSRRARSETETRLRQLGFSLDPDHEHLGNTLDLDLLVWKRMSEGNDMRQGLPFRLEDEARVVHLMMKGSACWSLQSNARPHPAVAALYESLPTDRLPRFV